MRRFTQMVLRIYFLTLLLVCVAQAAADGKAVAALFQQSCIKCHGGLPDGESILEAGLDLRTYESVMKGSEFGSVVEASNVDDSLIFLMIEEGDMPEEADPLSPDDIETIKTWIAEGAKNN